MDYGEDEPWRDGEQKVRWGWMRKETGSEGTLARCFDEGQVLCSAGEGGFSPELVCDGLDSGVRKEAIDTAEEDDAMALKALVRVALITGDSESLHCHGL